MRLSMVFLASVLVAMIVPSLPARAQDSAEFDLRIKRQLDALEYKYEIDEDGDFKLLFDVPDSDDRTQLVYVRSPVHSYGAHEVREIWALAYEAPGEEIPQSVANRLLASSMDSKLGAWAKQDGYAVFVVKVPVGATDEELGDAIDATVRTADEMEAELTSGQDQF